MQFWCLPTTQPDSCHAESWSQLADTNTGLPPCSLENDKQQLMQQYRNMFSAFVKSHQAEIQKFLAENKKAIDDVKDKIAASVEAGTFDIKHYQQVIQQFVNDFDLQKYRTQMMQFTKTHKAKIEQFMQAHNAQISAVKAEIKDAIDNGDFNFEEYQKEIKATFNQHMAEYNAAMQAFETGHQKEIAQFMSDHKEQVAAIKGQIDSGIRNGSFDFAHFKPAIEAMISEHESTATQYKDTAKKTLNKARTTVQGYMNKATEVTSRAPESQDDGYTMSALDTLQQQLLTAAPKMQQWVT